MKLMLALALAAASAWTGPGWYQVSFDEANATIIAGPYATHGDCRAALPEGAKSTYCVEVHEDDRLDDIGGDD